MKKTIGFLVIAGFALTLGGCFEDKPKSTKELTCDDDPKGRPRAEQIAIGDACFRGKKDQFHKSPYKEW